MQAKLKANGAVSSGRRRGNCGVVGSAAYAPENLIAARLRRLAIRTGKNRAGLTALFSGPSGTGKTLAAALARSLGKNIYRVDVSAITEDYIGETEKNLSRLFANARKQNAILFFDEADALFGKRTNVTDSHDRYANLEVSHLLARMARHRGIVILSTNGRTEIDPAISRRFQVVVKFPKPDSGQK
ncbi:MAG: SpoVK/Ycf46/Vps4 family AAA+-type ATPase [Paracoccaceae bacterium]|jgi:SpoVK/Ycf46/Vps4 family AAA+-type ATPase